MTGAGQPWIPADGHQEPLQGLPHRHPGITASHLSLQQLPVLVFYPTRSSQKVLSYLKSDTFRLANDYLAHIHFSQQSATVQYYTILNLIERGGLPLARKMLKALQQELAALINGDDEHLLLTLRVSNLLLLQAPANRIEKDLLLQASLNKLNEWHIINTLRYNCEFLNRKLTINLVDEFHNPLIEPLAHYLQQQASLPPLIALYFQLYITLKEPGQGRHFDQLIIFLDQYQQLVNANEYLNIYLATINICLRKLRTADQKYTLAALDLYEQGIKTKILLENGVLSESTYNNVVRLAVRVSRFDWAEEFILTYNKALRPLSQKNARHLNLTELAFSRMAYGLALSQLNEVKTTIPRNHIVAKILLIKTFYEMGETQPCLSVGSCF